MEPDSEKAKFVGVIRSLREGDIPDLRKISEFWLRDNGVIAYEEVDGDMKTLGESLLPDSGKSMFVAESEAGEVVGMMGLSAKLKPALMRFARTDNPSELIIAYVDPNYVRGKRVGTLLINRCQDLEMGLGKKEILLESGPRHEDTGHPFYDKQSGFSRVGVIPDFYGPGLDTVVWQKTFN